MPYRDNRFWDPKKGWVRPKRGLVIERRRPQLSIDEQYIDDYDNAPMNNDWNLKDKNTDFKEGYNHDTKPSTILRKHYYEVKSYYFWNKILNLIPFVTVKEIAKEDTTKNPFTRRD